MKICAVVLNFNPYIHSFVGLSEFTDEPIFDSSLFVTIRKRIGVEDFNSMSVSLLEKQVKQMEEAEKRDGKEDKGEEPNGDSPDAEEGTRKEVKREDLGKEFTDEQGRLHKGVLKIDATCSDAEVRYLTMSISSMTAARSSTATWTRSAKPLDCLAPSAITSLHDTNTSS